MMLTKNRIANQATGTVQRTMPIIRQVNIAVHKSNRLALIVGFVVGGFIPLATYVLAHYELMADAPLWQQFPALLVLGGLSFSAKTVFDWACAAFKHPAKALGFVLLLEGVMTFAHTPWLSIAALCFLVGINGTATGCTLVLDYRKKELK